MDRDLTDVRQHDELEADTSGLRDLDGDVTVESHQWLRNGEVIAGATGETYTLTQADVGQGSRFVLRRMARRSFSAPTPPVANVNDPVEGDVVITNTAAGRDLNDVRQNDVLEADTSGLERS